MICSNRDGPRDYHTKGSKLAKNHMAITYMQNLKNDINELIYKTDIDSQTRKQT